jgi:hypothetical protein
MLDDQRSASQPTSPEPEKVLGSDRQANDLAVDLG